MCVKMSTALVTARQAWRDAGNGRRWLKYASDLGSNQYLFLRRVESPFLRIPGSPRISPILASNYHKQNEFTRLTIQYLSGCYVRLPQHYFSRCGGLDAR